MHLIPANLKFNESSVSLDAFFFFYFDFNVYLNRKTEQELAFTLPMEGIVCKGIRLFLGHEFALLSKVCRRYYFVIFKMEIYANALETQSGFSQHERTVARTLIKLTK